MSMSVKVGALRNWRGAAGDRAHLARHPVEQALEGKAHVDGAVATEAARRRVGHALADVLTLCRS
jgi:hypothetical protein